MLVPRDFVRLSQGSVTRKAQGTALGRAHGSHPAQARERELFRGHRTIQDYPSPQPRKTRILKTLPRIPARDPDPCSEKSQESLRHSPLRLFPTFVQKVLICILKALRGPPAKEPNFV